LNISSIEKILDEPFLIILMASFLRPVKLFPFIEKFNGFLSFS